MAEIKFYGAHQKNLNEDRPILSGAKCRLMILVNRNIRYTCGYSCGFLGEGTSNTIGLHVIPASRLSTRTSTVKNLHFNGEKQSHYLAL